MLLISYGQNILPYKQEVAGSSPALPTIFSIKTRVFGNALGAAWLRCTSGVLAAEFSAYEFTGERRRLKEKRAKWTIRTILMPAAKRSNGMQS